MGSFADEDFSDPVDAAYYERNQVVLLAARMAQKLGYPVGIGTDPDEPGWPVLFIDLPDCGQVSWHLPQSQLTAIQDLDPFPAYAGEWDGHDTDEKYNRVDLYTNPLSFG